MNTTTFEPVIGMEIHVELATISKMFCGCKNDPFGADKPNIYTCPVCLGLPGALPVANKRAIEWTVLLGQALHCTISRFSKFDRKNYFYPDLAKGYQISQYDMPLCANGIVHLPEGEVRITRVHLEEDTGKLLHTTIDGKQVTLVDFNRSGVPLVEIVTEPDIHSSAHAKAFVKALAQIVRYTGISHADLEKGSMRLEPNISVRQMGETSLPNYKVEVKNINSFNFVKKAIDFEVKRHIEILKTGKTPIQETRGYVEDRGVTLSQRSKEDAKDYRYFPEPDIPPIRLSGERIAQIHSRLPEMPASVIEKFTTVYHLTQESSKLLAETPERKNHFEACMKASQKAGASLTAQDIANYCINKKISETTDPQTVVDTLLEAKRASDIPLDDIKQSVSKVLTTQQKAVLDYQSGKTGVLMFLVGMVKRDLAGKGDAGVIQKTILDNITHTNG